MTHRGSATTIMLKRGVKQGDPISPLIFNAIIDTLLEQLESLPGHSIDENHTISSLAFADDLILMAATREDAQKLLLHTKGYLRALGMKIAVTKCASCEEPPTPGT